MNEIKMWMQLFFEDGSVSQGKMFPVEWFEEEYTDRINKLAETLLEDLNRKEGWLLLWGAGHISFRSIFSSQKASESSS